jgi:predicted GIY-YIG superfamily endonuclease
MGKFDGNHERHRLVYVSHLGIALQKNSIRKSTTTAMTSIERYKPLNVFGACYVLELTGGRVYVGWSRNLSSRLSEHWAGNGSVMTRTYPPIKVLQIVFPADHTIENKLTKHYANCRGWQKADNTPNVRGGDFAAFESRNPTKKKRIYS